MLTVWRLVTARFAGSAFSGEGARRYGGRWNHKGIPLIYTASSQSLAVLEMLVQDTPLRARYVSISAMLPDELAIAHVRLEELPPDWRDTSTLEVLRTIGSDWANAFSTAVLAVPSAVIPAETNYLLNPRHPAFGAIALGAPRELVTDLRLIRKGPLAG